MPKFKSNKFLKTALVIVPLVIMVAIQLFSIHIFETNSEQTYQNLKAYKEDEVRRLVVEIDKFLMFTDKDKLEDEETYLIKTAINELNRGNGVYCYLLDTNYNLLEEYNNARTDEEITLLYQLKQVKALRTNMVENNNNDNHFSINVHDGKGTYDFYWQPIPTHNSEYYILLGISKSSITTSRALEICKVFISILNIVLVISLYGNIALIQDRRCKNNKGNK